MRGKIKIITDLFIMKIIIVSSILSFYFFHFIYFCIIIYCASLKWTQYRVINMRNPPRWRALDIEISTPHEFPHEIPEAKVYIFSLLSFTSIFPEQVRSSYHSSFSIKSIYPCDTFLDTRLLTPLMNILHVRFHCFQRDNGGQESFITLQL